MAGAQTSEEGQSAPSEAVGFSRIMSVATLVLVAAVAILTLFNLFATNRAADARPAAAQSEETPNTSAPSTHEADRRLARLEEQLNGLAGAPEQTPTQAAPARAGAQSQRNCVRIYRSGTGMQLVCARP